MGDPYGSNANNDAAADIVFQGQLNDTVPSSFSGVGMTMEAAVPNQGPIMGILWYSESAKIKNDNCYPLAVYVPSGYVVKCDEYPCHKYEDIHNDNNGYYLKLDEWLKESRYCSQTTWIICKQKRKNRHVIFTIDSNVTHKVTVILKKDKQCQFYTQECTNFPSSDVQPLELRPCPDVFLKPVKNNTNSIVNNSSNNRKRSGDGTDNRNAKRPKVNNEIKGTVPDNEWRIESFDPASMIYNIDTVITVKTISNWNNINKEQVECIFTLMVEKNPQFKVYSLPAAVLDLNIVSHANELLIPVRPPLLTSFLRLINGYLQYEMHDKFIEAEVIMTCNAISSTTNTFYYVLPAYKPIVQFLRQDIGLEDGSNINPSHEASTFMGNTNNNMNSWLNDCTGAGDMAYHTLTGDVPVLNVLIACDEGWLLNKFLINLRPKLCQEAVMKADSYGITPLHIAAYLDRWTDSKGYPIIETLLKYSAPFLYDNEGNKPDDFPHSEVSERLRQYRAPKPPFLPSEIGDLIVSHIEDSENKALVSHKNARQIKVWSQSTMHNYVMNLSLMRMCTQLEEIDLLVEPCLLPQTSEKFTWELIDIVSRLTNLKRLAIDSDIFHVKNAPHGEILLIQSCTQLHDLSFKTTGTFNLEWLSGYTNLTALELDVQRGYSILGIENFTNLKEFHYNSRRLTNESNADIFQKLAQCTHLQNIGDLSDSTISQHHSKISGQYMMDVYQRGISEEPLMYPERVRSFTATEIFPEEIAELVNVEDLYLSNFHEEEFMEGEPGFQRKIYRVLKTLTKLKNLNIELPDTWRLVEEKVALPKLRSLIVDDHSEGEEQMYFSRKYRGGEDFIPSYESSDEDDISEDPPEYWPIEKLHELYPNLEVLELHYMQLESPAAIKEMIKFHKLRRLDLHQSAFRADCSWKLIADYFPLTLESLVLRGCDDAVISQLQYFPRLRELEIHNGRIKDLAIIHLHEHVPNIERLKLENCRDIKDYSPLVKCRKLTHVIVDSSVFLPPFKQKVPKHLVPKDLDFKLVH